MMSIYVSGLPHYVKDWDLRNFFQKWGRVVSVRLNAGRRSGLRSGFVNFAEQSSAQQALGNRHPLFLGRRIHVAPASAAVQTANPYGLPPLTTELPPHPQVQLGPVGVKAEPRLADPRPPPSIVIKQEPGVLRPPVSTNDPFQQNEFVVSSNPFVRPNTSLADTPPQVKGVFGIGQSAQGVQRHEPSKHNQPALPRKSSSKMETKTAPKWSLAESDHKKSKKKLMTVGSLKLPQSAAEFVEANKKHFEEKSFCDKSPEEELPPEIIEEKERIVQILNNGASDKLQRLQLIGKKKAEAIIAYRRLRGKFRKVEDLAKISLFGDQFMQRFKEANFIT